MEIQVEYSPAFAIAHVRLEGGESCKAESGAMVAMTDGITIDTGVQGGLLKGFKRAMMGGESFFMNTFSGHGGGGEVSFAPTLAGDVKVWDLDNQAILLQSGAYLASAMGIEVDPQFGGAKTLLSNEGLFLLRCQGSGKLLIAAYGAIEERKLAEGERYTVDSGHIVGWSESVKYEISKVGDWKSTMLSGEGIVAKLTGPGTVWLQTRSPSAFLGWLIPQIPGLPKTNTKTN